MNSILGWDRGKITRPKAKKLQITNRVRTKRFNKVLMKHINNHRLLRKARDLET